MRAGGARRESVPGLCGTPDRKGKAAERDPDFNARSEAVVRGAEHRKVAPLLWLL